MESVFGFLSTALTCLTVLGLAFMVVLSLPQSRMRDVMKHVLTAVFCVIYVISPVDFLPEIALGPVGLVDDLGAVMLGIISAKKALSSNG